MTGVGPMFLAFFVPGRKRFKERILDLICIGCIYLSVSGFLCSIKGLSRIHYKFLKILKKKFFDFI